MTAQAILPCEFKDAKYLCKCFERGYVGSAWSTWTMSHCGWRSRREGIVHVAQTMPMSVALVLYCSCIDLSSSIMIVHFALVAKESRQDDGFCFSRTCKDASERNVRLECIAHLSV